jgi:serpin B
MKRFIVMLLVLPMGSMSKAEAASGEKGAGQVVEGNSEFALDLYARLRQRPGNLFLSPYSISTALAMTYAGAQGETAAEMAKTLHFRLESDRLHAAFAALIRQTDEKQGQLFVANALWGQKGDHFLPDFLKRTRDQYGAGLNEVDFRAETEKARQTINAWVEERTGHKISNLLKPPLPSSDTSLVLTNAIYFKGYWSSPFPKPATTEADFRIAADQPVRVPMMQQTGRFPYLDDGTFQALELPYEGKAFSMVVLLPKRLDGLLGNWNEH